MATALLQGITPTRDADAEQLADVHAQNVRALTARVQSIKAAKVDAVADTRALRAVAIASGDNYPAQVVLKAPGGLTVQIADDVPHAQFAQLFGIDKRYYDRMKTNAAPLLAENLNWWLQQTPNERLLRMLRPEGLTETDRAQMAAIGSTVRLRGVLGKGYRTIDDADLVAGLLPVLEAAGATLQEFSIDERRMHAAFYTPARDVQQIRQAYAERHGITLAQLDAQHGHAIVNGRDIGFVNETLASGVVIRHSEVGFASIGASFVQKILKCLNRLVSENAVNIRHVGGKNGDAGDDMRYVSDSTQLMENAALLGRVADTVKAQFDDARIVERAGRVLVAKTEPVERPAAMPLFEFVGNIGGALGMTDAETDRLKEETVKSVAEEGGEVKFAFIQGITATAREMTDYDRRLEFERQGFALLNDDAGALLKMARGLTTKTRNN
jgi:hypothetical protein